MVSAPRWWDGLGEIDVLGPERSGGDGAHRLGWKEGRFTLAAHPDPEAERALGALGAPRCPCLDVLDAWEACHVSGAMLVAGTRSDADPIRPPVALARSLSEDLDRWRRAAGALVRARVATRARVDVGLDHRLEIIERAAVRRLGFLVLLGLDPRLQHRLQASVAATLEAGGRSAALEVATAARALPVLRSVGWTGSLPDIRLGQVASIAGQRATLPPSWMASVWGRGLADAVEGHLVVEVTARHPDGSLDVIAVAPGKSGLALRVDRWETRDNTI